MSQFPSAIPTDYNSSASEFLSTMAGIGHVALHNFEVDEIIALATKLGVGESTPAAGTVLKSLSDGESLWDSLAITDLDGFNSAALRSMLSDETGTGAAVFANSPTILTPHIASLTNMQHDHEDAAGGGQLDTLALLANSVTKATQVIADVGSALGAHIAAASGFVTMVSGSFTSQDGGDLVVIATFGNYKSSNTGATHFRVQIGSTNVPDATGWVFYWNTLLEHQSNTFIGVVSGVAAGDYTVNMQGNTAADSLSRDDNDQFLCTILELKR